MRRIAGVTGYTLLAVLMAGCFWTVPGQGANRQAFNSLEDQITPATVGSLQQVWSVQLDEGPAGDPVTSWSGVHVNDAHSVYGLATGTGAEQWQYSVAAPLSVGQPFVRDDKVLVGLANLNVAIPGTSEAKTVILDAASGAVTGEDLHGAIRGLRGSHALFASAQWYRFGVIQPIWLWLFSARVTDLDTSELLYDHIFDTGDSSQTLGMDMTLASHWVYLWQNAPAAGGPPQGLRGYALAGGAPAPGCDGGGIYTCPQWADQTIGFAPVLSNNQTIAYSAGVTQVKAFDASTGAVLWTGSLGFPAPALPALANGLLYVPTESGTLEVFDADGCGAPTCAPLWSASALSPITEQPAVAGGVVYTASADGFVRAFDAAGCATPPCAPIWSASTGSPITGAPAVSDGKLYVGTEDGRLITYGEPS